MSKRKPPRPFWLSGHASQRLCKRRLHHRVGRGDGNQWDRGSGRGGGKNAILFCQARAMAGEEGESDAVHTGDIGFAAGHAY